MSARFRDAIADARRYVTEFPHSIEAFGSSSMKAVLDQHDREVERYRDEIARLFAGLDVRPEELPQPNGRTCRRWYRLGWLAAQAVARDCVRPARGIR